MQIVDITKEQLISFITDEKRIVNDSVVTEYYLFMMKIS